MENEKRLIDANALSEAVSGISKNIKRPRAVELACLCLIAETQTIDAVEVVRWHWVLLAEFFDGSICTECSVCGEEYTYKKGRLELIGFEYAKYNYCPNCGAIITSDKCENCTKEEL